MNFFVSTGPYACSVALFIQLYYTSSNTQHVSSRVTTGVTWTWGVGKSGLARCELQYPAGLNRQQSRIEGEKESSRERLAWSEFVGSAEIRSYQFRVALVLYRTLPCRIISAVWRTLELSCNWRYLLKLDLLVLLTEFMTSQVGLQISCKCIALHHRSTSARSQLYHI